MYKGLSSKGIALSVIPRIFYFEGMFEYDFLGYAEARQEEVSYESNNDWQLYCAKTESFESYQLLP